jgi:hypothetical protein
LKAGLVNPLGERVGEAEVPELERGHRRPPAVADRALKPAVCCALPPGTPADPDPHAVVLPPKRDSCLTLVGVGSGQRFVASSSRFCAFADSDVCGRLRPLLAFLRLLADEGRSDGVSWLHVR